MSEIKLLWDQFDIWLKDIPTQFHESALTERNFLMRDAILKNIKLTEGKLLSIIEKYRTKSPLVTEVIYRSNKPIRAKRIVQGDK